jgi:hypothetical protein
VSDDFWAEFERYSDEDAPEFKFDKIGDAIVGRLRHRAILDTKYGRKPKLVIETDEGLRTIWAGQAQLTRKLGELKPTVGDKIGIRWTGEDDTGQGNPMKVFAVKLEKSASTRSEPVPHDDYDEPPF